MALKCNGCIDLGLTIDRYIPYYNSRWNVSAFLELTISEYANMAPSFAPSPFLRAKLVQRLREIESQ